MAIGNGETTVTRGKTSRPISSCRNDKRKVRVAVERKGEEDKFQAYQRPKQERHVCKKTTKKIKERKTTTVGTNKA